ncbi:hypothetical protein CI1B_06460 [Bradyrhizobium ivorense]|uniref:DUF2865 domain-containing protein n=1 Tax=Bradyrhizobium ivorense TaxID=2511166 RepID=A0A508SS94_9BRAD|nr:DUF2865 domain-containing protein [Bradyrhizobium ivorense]VIO65542.1 hypothetical protein CI1B_06460 [Bradyrhizobium ivorense]
MARASIAALVVLGCSSLCAPASAQLMPGDTAYAAAPAAPQSFFVAPDFDPQDRPRTRVYIPTRSHSGGSQNFCVRTCDGRYFPLPRLSEAANVSACEAVCPAAEVQLYAGADIESARTEQGQPYKTLANAFRFQREIVPQCACRAGTPGLSPVAIENDMTLRTGDIVAADDGFKIAAVSGGHRRSVLFRPLSKARAQALGLARISSR